MSSASLAFLPQESLAYVRDGMVYLLCLVYPLSPIFTKRRVALESWTFFSRPCWLDYYQWSPPKFQHGRSPGANRDRIEKRSQVDWGNLSAHPHLSKQERWVSRNEYPHVFRKLAWLLTCSPAPLVTCLGHDLSSEPAFSSCTYTTSRTATFGAFSGTDQTRLLPRWLI